MKPAASIALLRRTHPRSVALYSVSELTVDGAVLRDGPTPVVVEEVGVVLHLHGAAPVSLSARVAGIERAKGVRLEFLAPSDAARRAIAGASGGV